MKIKITNIRILLLYMCRIKQARRNNNDEWDWERRVPRGGKECLSAMPNTREQKRERGRRNPKGTSSAGSHEVS